MFDDANCVDLTSARLANNSNAEPTSYNKKEVETKIYPNPCKGVFYIEVNSLKGNAQLEIVTIEGKVMKQYNLCESSRIYLIDMDNLESGIYFCRIKQETTVLKTEKIILYNDK